MDEKRGVRRVINMLSHTVVKFQQSICIFTATSMREVWPSSTLCATSDEIVAYIGECIAKICGAV